MNRIVRYALVLYVLFSTVSTLRSDEDFIHSRGEIKADITFLAADLKYNREEGIKICEIQSGSSSAFNGFDYVVGQEGLFAKTFCAVLEQYHTKLWFTPGLICDSKMKAEFLRHGFDPVENFLELGNCPSYKEGVHYTLYNPWDVRCYRGVFYTTRLSSQQCKQFRESYSSVLLMDGAAMPYLLDKLPMTKLFSDERLKGYKPKWNVYKKYYSTDLAERISGDIGGELFVIKPRKGSLGQGIIIVDRKNLDQALRTIFQSKIQELRNHELPEYRYWGYDKCDSFIVEAFAKGSPIKVEELGGGTYDGIVRILFLLVHSEGKTHIHYLPAVMILPKKSLEEKGSLTEKHKSVPKAPYFTKVPEDVLKAVQEQLDEMLPIFYSTML